MKYFAFSLSEVLITLGIIGIVAAMTLPTLVLNYQKKQTITRLKKTYTLLSETINMSTAKYGDITTWDWALDTLDFFEQYIGYNFKYTKNCKYETGCWNKDGAFQINGTIYDDNPNKSYWVKILINDGTMLAMQKQDNSHVHINIDLNGYNKPNMYGKDIFIMTLSCEKMEDNYHQFNRPGIFFFGHGLTRDELITNSLGCTKDKAGLTCGEMLLIDGWKIKKDYPW